jgi:indolepyruvate ferredoxin oxidoreductase, alpha subunit
MEPQLLTGNQALARAAIDSGVRVATSYPGSPTVQILETLATADGIHAEWSPSEKVAMEVAIGASMAGVATLVSMKHVGVNIAADPLMTFTFSRLNGPLVIAVGDDPGQISSQNEQDSRMWAEYGMMPMLQPATPQEAYDLTRLAFDISARFEAPVFVRMVDRTCHMMGRVLAAPPAERELTPFEPDPVRYYQIPPFSRTARARVEGRIGAVEQWLEQGHGFREAIRDTDLGVVTFGVQHPLVRELLPGASTFKLDVIWPLPLQALRRFADQVDRVIVVEELTPFVQSKMQLAGIECEGSEMFPRFGEIGASALRRVFAAEGLCEPADPAATEPLTEVSRGAMLCPGCPHRPVMVALRELGILCHGDIGCYLMGSYPPFEVLKTSISMGASIGIAQGMARALEVSGLEVPPMVSVIGDSTLCHSGLPSVINYGYNDHHTRLLVLDNRSTSMTGLQDNPVTGRNVRGQQNKAVDLEQILTALGFDHVTRVNQYNLEACRRVFREEFVEQDGPRAVIATGPCALKYKKQRVTYYVDPETCIGCRSCVKVGCPPISMRAYPDTPAGARRSHIDQRRCVGCSICYQVCPVKAIKPLPLGKTADVPAPLPDPTGEEE